MDKKTIGMAMGLVLAIDLARNALTKATSALFKKRGETSMPMEGCIDRYNTTEDGRKCIDYFDEKTGNFLFRAVIG